MWGGPWCRIGLFVQRPPRVVGPIVGTHLEGSVRRIRSTGMLSGFRQSGRRCCLLVPARPLQRRIKDLLLPSLTHLHQCLRGRPVLFPNFEEYSGRSLTRCARMRSGMCDRTLVRCHRSHLSPEFCHPHPSSASKRAY